MTTYAQLQADVIQYSGRDDVSASVPMFIRLAENEIYRRVRTVEMETSTTFTFSSPDYEATLPSDWLGFKRLKVLDSANPKCQYVGPDVFAGLAEMSPGNFAALIGDAELIYTVEANKIIVNQPRGATEPIEISAVYFKRPLPLATDDVNNPLLIPHFDLFLYSTLVQLWMWADELEQEQRFQARADRVTGQIDEFDRTRRRVAGTAKRTNARAGVI